MVQKNLERNINKICLMNFLDGMWFALPVYVIFLLDNGMSLTDIGIILGASSIMPFFFDIPSSVWADKYSRKFVMILSSMAFTLANLAFYLASSFEHFFIGACLNGIGIALSTGIFSALVYDTLLSLGKEKGYEKTQAKVVKSFFGCEKLFCRQGRSFRYRRIHIFCRSASGFLVVVFCRHPVLNGGSFS